VHSGIEESQRLRAIDVLGARVDSSASVDTALLLALESDGSDRVKAMAQEGLLRRHKLSSLATVPRSRLRCIGTRLLNPLSSIRKQALAELAEILAELRAGKTPESLGLVSKEATESPALSRFQNSVSSEKKGAVLDLAAFLELKGDERAWAEVLLLFLLGKADARAIQAAATLHFKQAEPALRELAGRSGDTATLARRALAAL
jgi:hypothetical protein